VPSCDLNVKQHIFDLWSGILQQFVELSHILEDNFTFASKYSGTISTFFIRDNQRPFSDIYDGFLHFSGVETYFSDICDV
jgi:hypothetical protein